MEPIIFHIYSLQILEASDRWRDFPGNRIVGKHKDSKRISRHFGGKFSGEIIIVEFNDAYLGEVKNPGRNCSVK